MDRVREGFDRFTGRAAAYDRYRERYPVAMVLDRLRSWCGLQPNWIVADIGAGTGMLSEVFLCNGNPVLAIEPNQEMRAACEQLSARFPLLQVRHGSAEETGLGANSVAVVAAGRTFHWFDIPRALLEFERILQPNGWLVLVSQGRAKEKTPQFLAFEDLLMEHGADYACMRASYSVHEDLDRVFTADRHSEEIPGQQILDWDGLLGQAMSFSVAPQPHPAGFAGFERRLREFFHAYAVDGLLTVPPSSWINTGRIGSR
ncbi:MAG: class I SAM-dependent methyltransferase [Acidobacteriaceae bacterium]